MTTERGGRAAITIAIVDDERVVHAGVGAWLTGTQPAMEVVAGFADTAGFIARYPSATPELDVTLFALQFAVGGPRFDVLRQICEAGHRVVVYSYLSSAEVILTSLDAGAMSYIGKFEGGTHLLAAICAAAQGRRYVGAAMDHALRISAATGRPRLTGREKELLCAWIQMGSKHLVADRQFVETSTVRGHLERIRAKYADAGRPAATKAALTARAIQDGLLCLGDIRDDSVGHGCHGPCDPHSASAAQRTSPPGTTCPAGI
ncbi:DNA-binding response regulator [Mycolicibacterium rufum]|uniref:DNA-binding response regulator n=2 Tax=Mycolicibacterium rufum TaxID=318424 RepID=A0ABY3UF21_9MYCO|nr:DNA-binding response regulator [Mycolicibacterium rufum]ULP36301.1 DNA-binding response regulator [Mycolicibacterium rufum]